MKKILISLLLFLCFNLSFAQKADNEEEDTEDYDNEFTYGINWNTNGGIIGGFSFNYAFRKKKNQFHRIGLELVSVVDSKEILVLTGPRDSSNAYVSEKKNRLFVIRLNYGREYVLFHKAEEEGVRLSAIWGAGPSIAILQPYNVLYGSNYNTARDQPYQKGMNPSKIYGSSSYFTGLEKSTVLFGFHAKASLNFEFGQFKDNITGVEVGFMLESYNQRLELIANNQSKNAFSSVFITLYYGFRD